MPITINEDAFYSPDETAQVLGYDIKTLASYRSQGGGPPFSKRGKRILYHGKDLAAWLLGGRVKSSSQEPPMPLDSKRVYQKHILALLNDAIVSPDKSVAALAKAADVTPEQAQRILAGDYDNRCAPQKVRPLREQYDARRAD